jgi:hypothetical protein
LSPGSVKRPPKRVAGAILTRADGSTSVDAPRGECYGGRRPFPVKR